MERECWGGEDELSWEGEGEDRERGWKGRRFSARREREEQRLMFEEGVSRREERWGRRVRTAELRDDMTGVEGGAEVRKRPMRGRSEWSRHETVR